MIYANTAEKYMTLKIYIVRIHKMAKRKDRTGNTMIETKEKWKIMNEHINTIMKTKETEEEKT